jgi:hypothetical protein
VAQRGLTTGGTVRHIAARVLPSTSWLGFPQLGGIPAVGSCQRLGLIIPRAGGNDVSEPLHGEAKESHRGLTAIALLHGLSQEARGLGRVVGELLRLGKGQPGDLSQDGASNVLLRRWVLDHVTSGSDHDGSNRTLSSFVDALHLSYQRLPSRT